jgi:hypothetical protein
MFALRAMKTGGSVPIRVFVANFFDIFSKKNAFVQYHCTKASYFCHSKNEIACKNEV